MDKFLPYALFEGKIVPFEDAKISIATHALHYGTGAFGGMRGTIDPTDGKVLLFRPDRHAKRLSESARFLSYDLSAETIKSGLLEFIKANKPTKPFYIRPLVYTAGLGISPRLHNIEKQFFIYGMELDDYLPKDGVTVRISSWTRQMDLNLPLRGKISGAYITSSLARTEANSCGFDDAIFLNSRGKVCEATGMNIFVYRNGVLSTPGIDQDILEGITRDSIMTVAQDLGIKVVEREVDKTELFIAQEVFLCGTAAKITPVKKIENYILPEDRPITQKIREKLTAITENRDTQYASWVEKVTW